jgi:hypothetical protein
MPASRFQIPDSGIRHPVSGIRHPAPRLAVFHTDELVRCRVVGDLPDDRIPDDFFTAAEGDVAEVRDGRDVVADFDIEHGLLPRLCAVQEVANVRGSRIAAGTDFLRFEVGVIAFDDESVAGIAEEDRALPPATQRKKSIALPGNPWQTNGVTRGGAESDSPRRSRSGRSCAPRIHG